MADTAPRPEPRPTAETAAYWEAAADERLVVQRCETCGRHQFYPRTFCTACLSERLDWVQSAGLGRIYTFTVCRLPAHPSMTDKVPYAVAMIDLDEGVRLLTNIVDCPIDLIRVGARVAVRFERISSTTVLPQFTLTDLEDR
ncbi:Zn-ribbon domain-containing OB-fold protein [Saccharopolyspora sp. NPDC050642]|uniref:Zn-ribbon domain-containing OB-fold protein n=1 Tax=Saccharopolyspora sp. NPDC050642 TaxID=3157099 RepID=UPI0033CF2D7D